MINLKYSKTLKKYISVVVQYYPWLEVLLFFGFGYSKMRPCQGGSHVARLNFKTSRVGVYINACRLLSALLSLSQLGRGRLSLVAISFYAQSPLFGPCRLSQFTLAGPLR